jgi:hypothetical protein
VIFQINDMRLTSRLASAAAATVITAVMLVCVGVGFAVPAAAAGSEPSAIHLAATSIVGRFE